MVCVNLSEWIIYKLILNFLFEQQISQKKQFKIVKAFEIEARCFIMRLKCDFRHELKRRNPSCNSLYKI